MKKDLLRVPLSLAAPFLLLSFALLAASAQSPYTKNKRSVSVAGELEVIEECEETRGRTLYYLNAGGEKLEVKFSRGDAAKLRTGDRVVVKGRRSGDLVAADSVEKTASLSAEALPNTFGEHKVLVILVNFQDKQTQPYTPDQARDTAFNTTSNFYREASYGQTSLSGDVYGWFTIPVSSTTCDTTAIATYAKQAAANAGANLSAYNHYVYAFPGNACTFTGRGSVGGSPSQAWINEWFELGVVGHELGHNFGLYHSRSMDCGAASVGGTCTTDEYGDVFDIMGASNSAHFNPFQKERLGWLNYGGSPPLQTVTASGTYHIDAYEPGGTGPKALKILRSTDPSTGNRTWYYLEHRTAFGFDSYLSANTPVLNGVVVRSGSESSGQETYLLDMTPATAAWNDSPLVSGQTFTDPATGTSFTTLSADSSGAWIQVTIPSQPCTRANPSVSVTPGQSPWLRSGSSYAYTVTVTNNDGSGCGVGSFSLQGSVPAGWAAAFASQVFNLAPGASASTPMSVTSPIGAADGSYQVAASAVSPGAAATASGSASYSVVSALGVSAAPGSATYTRNQKVSVTASVSAAGSPVAGASVTFTMTKPGGKTVTQTATTAANGIAVFTYTFDKRRDPTGPYTVAVSAAANSLTGQAATSFVVSK